VRVILVSPNYAAASEHFIARHERYLAERLAATFTFAPPVPGAPKHVVFGHQAGPLFDLRARLINRLTGKSPMAQDFERTVRATAADLVLFEHGTSAEPLYRHCLRLGLPYAIHFHGGDITTDLPPEVAGPMFEAARAAAVNIANSEFTAGEIRRKIGAVRIAVKFMGVAVPERPPPLPEGPEFGVCQLGRLTGKKGPLFTIRAHQRARADCPDMALHLVGGGELRAECEAYVRDQAVPGVVFHGELPHAEAMAVLGSCQVLTQHSLRDRTGDCEGFGVALAEAMALGRAVVSTRHGPIPEVVEDGVTGILVDEGDWAAQAAALVRLRRSRELLAAMGAAGHERARRLFSEPVEAEGLIAILEGCLKP
jgi:colanic acid/amylovoran biosynthesis glycosyltransferase